MPEIQGFFVPCYECQKEIKVGPGTFRRVLAKQSWIVCPECEPMQTYCSENVGDPSLKNAGRSDVKNVGA